LGIDLYDRHLTCHQSQEKVGLMSKGRNDRCRTFSRETRSRYPGIRDSRTPGWLTASRTECGGAPIQLTGLVLIWTPQPLPFASRRFGIAPFGYGEDSASGASGASSLRSERCHT
jgi:hypothetical protein